jgi:hypothetical protein
MDAAAHWYLQGGMVALVFVAQVVISQSDGLGHTAAGQVLQLLYYCSSQHLPSRVVARTWSSSLAMAC